MKREYVFILEEAEDYEKFSGYIYQKILEDYIIIERFIYEKKNNRNGIWGITPDEKWKLMNVITSYHLLIGVMLYNAALNGESYIEPLGVSPEEEIVFEHISDDSSFWQKLYVIPLYKLLQLNRGEEPELVIMRIKQMIREYTREEPYAEWSDDDVRHRRYVSQLMKILGLSSELFDDFYEAFDNRSGWMICMTREDFDYHLDDDEDE